MHTGTPSRHALAEHFRELFAQVERELGDTTFVPRRLEDSSPARALDELAEREQIDLIVIGSKAEAEKGKAKAEQERNAAERDKRQPAEAGKRAATAASQRIDALDGVLTPMLATLQERLPSPAGSRMYTLGPNETIGGTEPLVVEANNLVEPQANLAAARESLKPPPTVAVPTACWPSRPSTSCAPAASTRYAWRTPSGTGERRDSMSRLRRR